MTAFVSMILLPILVHFVLKYICTYISGDIQYENVSVVLDHVYRILARIVNYTGFGVVTWSIYKNGIKKSMVYIFFSALGIMIPYLSDFLIEALTGSISQTYKIYLFSFLMYPFDFLTLVLIVFMLPAIGRFTYSGKRGKYRKNKSVSMNNIGKNEMRFAYSEKELNWAYLFITILMLALSLVNELYYTITFLWQLKNEYFRPIDPSEIISLVTAYFECLFFALIGYTVMKLIAYFLTSKVCVECKSDDVDLSLNNEGRNIRKRND